jgi:hypothetical protein
MPASAAMRPATKQPRSSASSRACVLAQSIMAKNIAVAARYHDVTIQVRTDVSPSSSLAEIV